ncbi:unnamed protein product [Thelazia callipaeda]|uniref:Eyes absent homolog n=1 Tax=Thelazia callipaeda TaxID=103827 RepID=A0A158RCG9_THECL|nr:unnamed protein product [Thelazia callipaeda]
MIFKVLVQELIFPQICSRESLGHLEPSTTTFLSTSLGWPQLSDGVKPENLVPTLSERPVTLGAMSDAAAATAAAAVAYDSRIISATPYYNGGYSGAGYAGMYAAASAQQNYYPAASSSLRGSAAAAAAATSFPFAAAAASHAYYSNNYNQNVHKMCGSKFIELILLGNGYTSTAFDYPPYPAAMHCYGGRSGYYGCSISAVPCNSSFYAMNPLVNDPNMPSNQLTSFSARHDIKKSSWQCQRKFNFCFFSDKTSKRRKNPTGANTPEKIYKRAFIWEMEDICVLSNFFLRSGDPTCTERLAHAVNSNVDRFISSVFGIDRNVQDCEYVNIEDASIDDTLDSVTYPLAGTDLPSTSSACNTGSIPNQTRLGIDWMRKLAVKYQHIKDTYNSLKNDSAGLLERTGAAERAELLALKATVNPLTQGWTESVKRCLNLIIERSSREHYANVLLSGENIISTLAKLLIMEQSPMIAAENVYSVTKVGKEAVIDRILSHFGKKCSFVIISTHRDTHEIAKKENIPLWKVKGVRDLELFHIALSHHLLS